MAAGRYAPDQIIHLLRESEVLPIQGITIGNAARQIGIGVQSCYR